MAMFECNVNSNLAPKLEFDLEGRCGSNYTDWKYGRGSLTIDLTKYKKLTYNLVNGNGTSANRFYYKDVLVNDNSGTIDISNDETVTLFVQTSDGNGAIFTKWHFVIE